MVSTNSERLNLINNFRSTTRIYASLPTPSQIVTTLEKNLYNAAFIIHSIRAKYPSADYGEMNMEDMNIEVSFITDGGEVQENDKRLVIDGTIVETLIHTANSKQKKHYIFDETSHHQYRSNVSLLQRKINASLQCTQDDNTQDGNIDN